MDNTQVVIALFNYVEDQYPIGNLRKRDLKRQSYRRWGILELCNRILDKPNSPPIEISEAFVGQLTSMIYRMEERGDSKERILVFKDALYTVLSLEKYFNEVYA